MNKKQVRANFRRVVFARDGMKCRCCGVAGYDRQDTPVFGKVPLDAHHIQNRNRFVNGGYCLKNGISVCPLCHIKAEKYHQTDGQGWEPEFRPDDLYVLISSSFEEAAKMDVS